MKILIRADASITIGTGHVMRCLTFADFMRERGHLLSFMVDSSLKGNLVDLILSKGYQIYVPDFTKIPINIDWLVVDHYSLGKIWEKKARAHAKKIMVIDDLANREHDCDLLLDQNLYINMNRRYQGKVPNTCKLLLGPEYTLIRDEFISARENLLPRTGKIERLFVNFGGTDPHNITEYVLNFIKDIKLEVNVVVGKKSNYLNRLEKLCEKYVNFNLHVQTNEMAKLMLKSDLAITAGGSTTWERACVGLPAIVIAIAENQIELSKTLAQKGGCFYAGFYADAELNNNFRRIFEECLSNSQALQEQSRTILQLVDGHGKEKVANYLENLL